MAQRNQRGWLKKENRAHGETWVLFFRTSRKCELAQHYAEHELVNHTESIHPKVHTTIKSYERVLRNRLLPKWGPRIALGIEPLEIEEWLTTLKKKNLKIRRSTECDVLCRWCTGTGSDMA